MRTLTAGALVLWATTSVVQAEVTESTAYELYSSCTSGTAFERGYCLGFIANVFKSEGCGVAQKGQMKMAFEHWARGHPGLLQMSEFAAVQLAIDEAFCQCTTTPQPRVSNLPTYRGPDQVTPPR
jgi:hypothetical protein